MLLVEIFFIGVRGNVLVFSLHFLKFRLLWLLSFMELYMLWRKLKRWGLLIVMYGLNVIMSWFVLRLLLGLMFYECFVIDEILVLITMGKSGLGFLILKGMCVLISWLIYDLFLENYFIGITNFHLVCSWNSL